MAQPLGTVTSLHRFPVKSMRGERLTRAWLGPAGVAGDREWALLDEQRRWASAKADRKRWLLVDGMLDLRARTAAELGPTTVADHRPPRDGTPPPAGPSDPSVVVVTLPDGREATAGTAEADALLSDHLGRPLRFDRGDQGERWGRHHDAAPVHLVTTSTLDALPGPDGSPLDPMRLRPNLVVAPAPGGPDFAEDGWIGRHLRVGDALLRVTERTERCVMTTRAQGDELPHAPTVLRRIGQANQACAGVYLAVVEPGAVAVGDPLLAVAETA
ncbi:MOSC domain-containing protein [Patulibacter defluvii]|uniref:MOSC domain-containing protein n=1 Tax=Patulibacter defluvii TaxID=3095358 RepID=UPI002A74F014|nr:MOSC domain-containing protein [Patulibacter sp. DM4]